jgi:hypothetical protein
MKLQDEKVQELIKQSLELVTKNHKYIGDFSYNEINPEKLIALVVEQCINICEIVAEENSVGCKVNAADVCGYKIANTFYE